MKTLTGLTLAASLAIAPAAHADDATIAIKLFQFKPKSIEVKAGSKITWTNGDDIEHSVTAGPPGKSDGTFDSGFFGKGGSFAFTFAKPGTYTYFCKRHPSMTATVVVTQ